MATRGNPNIAEAGLPYRFKPGEAPISPGRPYKRPITTAYEVLTDKVAELVNPGLVAKLRRAGYVIAKKATMADVLALAQYHSALGGKTRAATEIREAIEGKSRQRTELTFVQQQQATGEATEQEEGAARPGSVESIVIRVKFDDEPNHSGTDPEQRSSIDTPSLERG